MSGPSPAQQESALTYQDHVLPIFTNHCMGCHNADKKKGDLDLSTYSAMMAGGGAGDVVAPGDATASPLFKVVAHLAEPKMPPKKPKISDPEILTIKKWIDGGLIDARGGKAKKAKGPAVDLALKAASTGKPKGPAAMPEDLNLEPEVRTSKAEAVTALAASPWAPVAAVAGQHQVLLYHTDTLDLAGILPFPERRPTILRFSRNGTLLLAGGGRGAKLGRVVLYDVKSGDRVTEIGEEFDQVLAADLSPDQARVALGGPGKLVKIYDTKDGDLEHSIKKHTDWVTALEFSPDGVLLASGDRSGGLHVWEVRTGRIFYTLTGHKGAITDVSWRADANLLASSSEDGQVMLWEMGGGTRVKGWAAHPATASVKYSMDGRIVTCGRDMLVRTWDGNGTKLKDFEAFTDLALRAVFSHDGVRVIAGDWTGEIRVWSSTDAKRLGQLSTNPPTLAERMDAEKKLLDEANAKAAATFKVRATAALAVQRAEQAVAVAQQSAVKLQEEQSEADGRVAEADKAAAAAVQAVKDAQASLAARQNEAGDKAKALRKAQEALKQAENDPKLAEAAQKAKAEADLAANAMEPAQKALAEAQDAHKAAGEAKAGSVAVQAKAKQAVAESQAKAAAQAKLVEPLKAQLARAAQEDEAAKIQAAAVEARMARLKAAHFNVLVHAAKRELAKIQGEHEALGAKAEEARRAAAEADAKAKAAEQAIPAAQAKVKELQTVLAQAKAAPAKAEAAHKAAQKVQAEKEAKAAAAPKEAAEPLVKEAAEAKKATAARAAELEKAKAALAAAEKAVAEAQAAADQAVKNLPALKAAAKAAAGKIAPEQAQADAFKPKVDAARAKVEALKADYLKLKPKSL